MKRLSRLVMSIGIIAPLALLSACGDGGNTGNRSTALNGFDALVSTSVLAVGNV